MIAGLFANLWVKLAAAAIVVVALLLIYASWHHKVFQAGVDAQLAKDAKAQTHNAVVFNTFTDQMALWQAPIWTKHVEIVTQLPGKVETVTRIIHDNPTFAAVARPDDLARLRAARLDQTRAAANLGPSATAGR